MFHVLLSFQPDQNRIEINYSLLLYIILCFGLTTPLFYCYVVSVELDTNEMENFLIQFDSIKKIYTIHANGRGEESLKLR